MTDCDPQRRDDRDQVVVLYDGACGFCSRWVSFVLDRDPDPRLRFAAIQSAVGARLLAEHEITPDLSTMVLLERDRVSVRSTAVLRLFGYLGGAWPALRVFMLVPRVVRDGVYGFIAKRRHRLGGEVACRMPRAEMRERFLD